MPPLPYAATRQPLLVLMLISALLPVTQAQQPQALQAPQAKAAAGTALADCSASAASAATASAPVPAAAPPPSDAVCRDTAARTYNELAQLYTGLTQPERLRPEWQLPLKTLGERLTQLHGSIARMPSAAAWDCALVTQGLAQSRAELATLAPRP